MKLKIENDIRTQEPIYRFELNYIIKNNSNLGEKCTISFDFKQLESDIEKLITVLSKLDKVDIDFGLGKEDIEKLYNDGFIDSSDLDFIKKFEEENKEFIGPIFISELVTGEKVNYYDFEITYLDEYGSIHNVIVEI